MTQNIYDNEMFFTGYSQLARSTEGLEGAPEWPTLRALLPDIEGRTVLDLGCGFGWFCRWARSNGAAHVEGVDVSTRMLARARAETDDAAISYAEADLEHFTANPATFDLVYSSLALHYIVNLEALLAGAHRSLVPGGKLVFSVEHPMFTAPTNPDWSVDTGGRTTWTVDSYLDEGSRSTDWLAKDVIKQHRTIATYVNLLLRVGFAISQVCEWGPSEAQIAAHPDWARWRQCPNFLLIACSR